MTTDLTATERSRVSAPLEQAWTLPPRMYTSAEVFEHEVDNIFRRDWLCVGRVDQVAEPGDHLAVDVFDQPGDITHGDDGMLRALSNVCLHRAMPVATGSDNGRFLTCPYHLWSYDLQGVLRTAPMMEGATGFEPAQCQLPELALEVWEGFVFVSLGENPAPLASQLESLQASIANYGLSDLVIATTVTYDSPWNWKILVENFMEAYHHIGPHRETFQPTFPARDSHVVDNGGRPWALLRMPGNEDPDEPREFPYLPGLERHQRSDLLAAAVFPTCLFALTGTAAVWYELTVMAHDRMRLRIHYLLPPDVAQAPEVEEIVPFIAEGLRTIHEEDIGVNEGPWRGLNAPLTGQGRLSPYEAAIWQLNQLWVSRMDADA